MENRKLIYLFGTMFSILFALFYFFIFDSFLAKESIDEKTVYFNQVGLYKNVENSDKTIANLKERNIVGYTIVKDDVNAVVCGVSEDEAKTKELQSTLTELGITFIEKEVTLTDSDIISLWDQKEVTKVLEMMKY